MKHEWRYKDISESMYPYYFDCPQRLLDMTPVANAEWREAIRTHKKAVAARRK